MKFIFSKESARGFRKYRKFIMLHGVVNNVIFSIEGESFRGGLKIKPQGISRFGR
jgi:hypothetical protein